ncbi:GerMN domain-containing protein [Kribbella sp. CA-247076]|uniref:GerMN domain-containing protein n=1 Tax=Kribbella sp. CA-247076 TaxID=3239941 RepID=UPI003D8EDFBA
MRSRVLRPVAWVVAAVLVLVGCGVPLQDAPTPIEPQAIPSRLQSPGVPTTYPSTAETTVQVNFVRNDRLVSLTRQVPGADLLDGVIERLTAGPTSAEQADGITSALPPDLSLTVVTVQDARVGLELSGGDTDRSATENVLAVGQIVLSVTALPSVQEVTFWRNGAPVEALLADGALTTEPLTAADYEALRSP